MSVCAWLLLGFLSIYSFLLNNINIYINIYYVIFFLFSFFSFKKLTRTNLDCLSTLTHTHRKKLHIDKLHIDKLHIDKLHIKNAKKHPSFARKIGYLGGK